MKQVSFTGLASSPFTPPLKWINWLELMSECVSDLVHVVAQDWGRGVVSDRGSDDLLDGRGRLVDDCVESVVVIGGVVDGAHRTIGLNQRVLALDDISVAFLGLRLDVTGMRVLDAVVERVLRVGLTRTRNHTGLACVTRKPRRVGSTATTQYLQLARQRRASAPEHALQPGRGPEREHHSDCNQLAMH
uniref:Uncharacterized protein n=1 Tax=Anopheles culicifacies TaxID=139723 RepID=A0A182MFC9_9DIPT